MASGVSSIQTRPLIRPSFPSKYYYFSLFKPSPMAFSSSSRFVVSYSKTFHRREVVKVQNSSSDTFITTSPVQHRQEASYLTSPSIERKSVTGGLVSDSLKLGDKTSWKEETESMKRYRSGGPSDIHINRVGNTTYCAINTKEDPGNNLKGFSDGQGLSQVYRKRISELKSSWREKSYDYAEKPYDFTEKPYGEHQDDRSFGRVIGSSSEVDLLETQSEIRLSDVTKLVKSLKQKRNNDQTSSPLNGRLGVITEINDLDVYENNDLESNSIDEAAFFPEQVYEEVVEKVVKKKKNDTSMHEQLCGFYKEVLVVDSVSAAKKIVELLTSSYKHLVHACDTEVASIDVKDETPVDHGEIICFSIYSGPEADFGDGKSCIWVDVLDGGGKDILNEFAPFFEDPSIKKVWHNYSFDNHIVENYGIKVAGFHADTMHMARLWDSSRRAKGGYSLEALTGDPKVMSGALQTKETKLVGKISMKTIFGKKKLKKDGSEGKVSTMPVVEELQREERVPWICYSALDAMTTLKLYESLRRHLMKNSLRIDGNAIPGKSMFDFYVEYWRPFGELLVKMETEGMLVDRGHLAEIEKLAKAEQKIAGDRFRSWASKYCPDAKYMNIASDNQLRTLLFGGIMNRKNFDESLPTERTFKILNVENIIEEGKKVPKKYRDITLSKIDADFSAEFFTASGWPSMTIQALKVLAGKVTGEFDLLMENTEDPQSDIEDSTLESTDEEVVFEKQEPGKQDWGKLGYGTAMTAFPTEDEGREACHAIAALCEVCAIDTLISSFILPLQGSNIAGKDDRIHCSLNINTETGRLSARRPNLQNQPALEKDRYKIRQAFIAAPGNSLIVADYGQLELRILAHLANCKSMLDAFKAGGDFHSRTALNMYPHIRQAVDNAEVLLEWDPQPGEDKPPVPLLKDAFASERRKAKMLNFSIAYGKTPVGLARDWKVSVEEAKDTVDLWYRDRQEVLKWQEKRKIEARRDGCVRTLLGRARCFPSMENATYSQRGHIERAAINTPVQGSAADVAMCAMLEISNNQSLKELGWRLLLQVHDEVILEGPSESAEIAKAIVVDCMSKPFNGKNILKVDLAVDAKCAKNWYAAK